MSNESHPSTSIAPSYVVLSKSSRVRLADKAAFAWRSSTDPADSGTPTGLILGAVRTESVILLASIAPADVVTEWQLGPAWRDVADARRFVRLRRSISGKNWALVST